jgi:hypothetical protein
MRPPGIPPEREAGRYVSACHRVNLDAIQLRLCLEDARFYAAWLGNHASAPCAYRVQATIQDYCQRWVKMAYQAQEFLSKLTYMTQIEDDTSFEQPADDLLYLCLRSGLGTYYATFDRETCRTLYLLDELNDAAAKSLCDCTKGLPLY